MIRRVTVPIAALVLFIIMIVGQPAAAQGLGISAGGNFAQLSDIDAGDSEATFENVTGWHLHLWFDLPAGPVAIRPGVRYMDMGSVFEDASVGNLPTDLDDDAITLIEIPIDVRFRLNMPMITPYLMAGPVLRFPGSDDEDRLESFSLAGGAGIGAELGLGGIRLFPELKYTFGITRFTQDSYEIGGVTISPDEDQRLNAVMLSLGIGL